MRCLYCHNPDTWDTRGGKEIEAGELAADVLKYYNYIKDGGVTVSGGEPLLQIDFVTELFKILKERGLHTAVDTSGITFTEKDTAKFDELIKYCDLFLLDIKHIDSAAHLRLTGQQNARPLAFAKYLSDRGKDIWIRYVLVPDYTDNPADMERLAQFIRGLKTVKKVEVLPYHDMGKVKYEKLKIDYPLKNILPPSDEKIAEARRILNID